jgi:hypothetical protein
MRISPSIDANTNILCTAFALVGGGLHHTALSTLDKKSAYYKGIAENRVKLYTKH